MKLKLFGFVLALLSVATVGLVQLQSNAAMPGQVGAAPRCTATAVGARGSAFKVSGNNATVTFNVKGASNCKVQLSANSFYAPSMNGKPYSKQILYDRVTKNYTRGTYSLAVALPAKSTPAKGCYYQVDLTYGTHNITPVIAYGHGKLDCSVKQPAASCSALTVTPLDRTNFRFEGSATTKDGAKVTGYVYTVFDSNGQLIDTKSAPSSSLSNSVTYTKSTPGIYKVHLTVKTSLGDKNDTKCVKPFTVNQEQTPGVEISKLVDGVKYEKVALNTEFTYQIKVTNTGNVDLKNVSVYDNPDSGITLLSASQGSVANNKWSYTIPTLAKGESMTYSITAKVVEYQAGRINNTACVDAAEVPGKPDSCDNAEVEVPKDVEACNPMTGEILTGISKEEAAKYKPVNSPECKDIQVCVPNTGETKTIKQAQMNDSYTTDFSKCEATPKALPTTGPADIFMQLVGAASITGAAAYYVQSRRNG